MMNRLGFFAAMSAAGLPLPVHSASSGDISWTSLPQTFNFNSVDIGAEPTGDNRRFIFVFISSTTSFQTVHGIITTNTLAGATRTPIETYHGITGVDTYGMTLYVFSVETGTTANFSWTLDASGSINTGARSRAEVWVYNGPNLALFDSGKNHKAGDAGGTTLVTDTWTASAADDIIVAGVNSAFADGGPDQDGVLFTQRGGHTGGAVTGVDYTNGTTGSVSFDENIGGSNSEAVMVWATYKLAPEGMVRSFRSGYLEIATTETLYPWSFSAWIYLPDDPAANGGVMGISDASGNDGFSLRHSSSQIIQARADNPNATAASSGTHAIGQWMHVGAVFTASNDRKVYLNGTETAATNSWTGINDPTIIRIGATAVSDAGLWLKGYMCHAAVWKQALTAGNMTSLAAQGLPPDVEPTNLLAYLSLLGPDVNTVDAGSIGPFTQNGTISDAPGIAPPF